MNYNNIKTNIFGTKYYYANNELHREDGPAVEYSNGEKQWYKNGKLHREDGPAIEYANDDKFWYKNGMMHREDGPAIVYSSGTIQWYFHDIYYSSNDCFTNESWKRFIKTLIFS